MPPADRTEEARQRKRQEYHVRNPPSERPPEPLKARLIEDFLLRGIGKPIVWTYKIVLGWWLNPLMAGRRERKFREEVRTAFSFLFEECGARFVPYSDKSLYWVSATFTVKGLLFRISRARRDYSLEVAPAHAPNSWESLYAVIEAIDAKNLAEAGEVPPRAPLVLTLSDFAQGQGAIRRNRDGTFADLLRRNCRGN